MPHHLLSATDLSRQNIRALFVRAQEIADGDDARVKDKRAALALFNAAFPLPLKVEATLRTAGVEIVSVSTQMTPLDLIAEQIASSNADVVLFSHPQSGAAREISAKLTIPLLNAGDGTNENPMRALMDAFAIHTLKGEFENLRTALLGNLKFSAEAHSLARILGKFDTRLSFVSPAALSMPYDLTDEVRLTAYEVEETNDLETTLRKTDVLYLSTIDSQRVEKKIYDKLKNFYALTPETFVEAKEGLVILGEWDGADELLTPARPHVKSAAQAMLLALVESAVM